MMVPAIASRATPICILVVEDDPFVRAITAEGLREQDFVVVEAASAMEALTYLAAVDDVDVVFSDIQMPGVGDGIELALNLKETHPILPVILTSGAKANEASQGKPWPFIAKPYHISDVTDLVMKVAKK